MVDSRVYRDPRDAMLQPPYFRDEEMEATKRPGNWLSASVRRLECPWGGLSGSLCFEPCYPDPGVNGNNNKQQPKARFENLNVHDRKCLSSPNHIKSPDLCAFNMYIK